MSWWVGLSREQMRRAVQTHVFNTSQWRLTAPDFIGEDPMYRNPWMRAASTSKHRKEVGFNMGTTIGGVVLVRGDPRETSYDYDAAPAEQTNAVRRMEANRAYREWTTTHGYAWKDAMLIYAAYDVAATLTVLLKIGIEPEWTDDQRREFEGWCREHSEHVQQVMEMIE